MKKLILITGGSASGKTTLSNMICESLNNKATLISLDSYYKSTGDAKMNYDIPESFDFKLLESDLKKMLKNKPIKLPTYNFEKYMREGYREINANDYIILEGIHAMHNSKIRNLANLKIFVDTPSDTRLARRILRDISDLGRKTEDVISRWESQVQPSYIEFIHKAKRYVDIIIPWHRINHVGIQSIIYTIQNI